MLPALPLVHSTRGPIVECIHRGHLVVMNSRQERILSIGDPNFLTFARSAAKFIQVLPLIMSGVVEKFRLKNRHIAILCSSHAAEKAQVEAVRDVLSYVGLDEYFLQCGSCPSSCINHTCSGKHAGMLMLANHLGMNLDHYRSISHPVQQMILTFFASFVDMPREELKLGTDGCGVPVYALPLAKLAFAYARLGSPTHLIDSTMLTAACAKTIDAILDEPNMIAGAHRFDSLLIRATKGRIVGKMGADGIYAATFPNNGLGFALKIEDGAEHVLYPVVTEAFLQLGWITKLEASDLAHFHRPSITNCNGEIVGERIPIFKL